MSTPKEEKITSIMGHEIGPKFILYRFLPILVIFIQFFLHIFLLEILPFKALSLISFTFLAFYFSSLFNSSTFFFEEIKMKYINSGVGSPSVQGVLKDSTRQTSNHKV
jgi:hypothetical protein